MAISRLLIRAFVIGLLSILTAKQAAANSNDSQKRDDLLNGEASVASAESKPQRSILIGHNLTPTTKTLRAGGVTVGNYVAAVGVTDHIMLATSPWMLISYNMYSAGLRGRYELNESQELGVQAGYFKTGDFPPNHYIMEATSTSLGWSLKVNPHYTFQASVNHMWFIDETIPFSLRREPHNNYPYQFSITTLHTIEMVKHFGAMIEVGSLGVNYTYPQAYAGLSLHYINDWLLVQLGTAANSTVFGVSRLYTSRQSNWSESDTNELRNWDFSLHPEVQLQAFF